jgi:hypothetical protein
MLRRVVWYKITDVSEVLAASIIRSLIALMMEAVATCETSVNFSKLHSTMSQKTDIFIFVAVRT